MISEKYECEGQMNIADFIEQKKENLHPLFDHYYECKHSSKHLCDRWHGGDEYIKQCKAELIKGFSCAGCCFYCSQAPMHKGKCKFDCRKEK